MSNDNQYAFPQSVAVSDAEPAIASYDIAGGAGMTKREYFAAMAMQGLLSAEAMQGFTGADYAPEYTAQKAVEAADALLKQLNESEE